MSNRSDEFHWYHITQKGARNRPVFDKVKRRNVFVRAIAETDLEVHGFCVTPWRYHLLVWNTEAQVREGLLKLIGNFTGWFSALEGNRGPLLSAACEASPVEEDLAIQLLAEIHYLPVEHGLLDGDGYYEWSSYPAYIGTAECPPWLVVERMNPHVPRPSSIPPGAGEDEFDSFGSVSVQIGFEDSTLSVL